MGITTNTNHILRKMDGSKNRNNSVADSRDQPGQNNSLFVEYKCQIKKFINNDVTGYQKWVELQNWYNCSSGRDLFIRAFKENTKINPNTSTDSDSRIAAALPKSIGDFERKVKSKAYYKAMADLFILEMDHIVSIGNMNSTVDESFYYSQTQRFVKTLLLDSLCLFSDWGRNVPEFVVEFGVGRSGAIHMPAFYHGATQIIYGHGTPGLSLADSHAELTGAIIRQGLENRLRRAFGIYTKKCKSDNSPHPIMFSSFLKTLKDHCADVHMSVPIENIARIYHWANLIVHHGFRDYGWTQPRVLSYLQPILVGGVKRVLYRLIAAFK